MEKLPKQVLGEKVRIWWGNLVWWSEYVPLSQKQTKSDASAADTFLKKLWLKEELIIKSKFFFCHYAFNLLSHIPLFIEFPYLCLKNFKFQRHLLFCWIWEKVTWYLFLSFPMWRNICFRWLLTTMCEKEKLLMMSIIKFLLNPQCVLLY